MERPHSSGAQKTPWCALHYIVENGAGHYRLTLIYSDIWTERMDFVIYADTQYAQPQPFDRQAQNDSAREKYIEAHCDWVFLP